jgi:hypothetical protein
MVDELEDANADKEPGKGGAVAHVNCAIWATRNVNLGSPDPIAGTKAGNYKQVPPWLTPDEAEQWVSGNMQYLYDAWHEQIKNYKGFAWDENIGAPPGFMKIMIYRRRPDKKWDHHIITQAPDGSWTEKDGWGSGVKITNHEWELGKGRYVGCFIVPGHKRPSGTALFNAEKEMKRHR